MDAIELLRRYADRSARTRDYDRNKRVLLDGVVLREWRDEVINEEGRVERVPYELCALRALREPERQHGWLRAVEHSLKLVTASPLIDRPDTPACTGVPSGVFAFRIALSLQCPTEKDDNQGPPETCQWEGP